jgi:uncharacterized protein YndB with AHSA1/START domain
VLEISRPDKLVFTWASSHSVVDNSAVTLNFTKVGDNKTEILLSHAPIIPKGKRDELEKQAWHSIWVIGPAGARQLAGTEPAAQW